MLKIFFRQLSLFFGAVVLLLIFIVPAVLLNDAGHKTIATVLGWIGVALFVLSLLSIALEPLVRVFRKDG